MYIWYIIDKEGTWLVAVWYPCKLRYIPHCHWENWTLRMCYQSSINQEQEHQHSQLQHPCDHTRMWVVMNFKSFGRTKFSSTIFACILLHVNVLLVSFHVPSLHLPSAIELTFDFLDPPVFWSFLLPVDIPMNDLDVMNKITFPQRFPANCASQDAIWII